ncbi:2,4-dienoyl-CoA reductase [Litorimonas cladophorae]|uniref:2,4-dienoyl-CoA reductase n=1 Tax=Litorimonas cladophorae TaxID=1220491 RepID=A0A918KM38_9PROT|nr:NADH:flavin oxidoreductase/NADH oxidase family protein [Litorimonas cladophorae]GGX67698.1 2,4-dienoyl-CoA reductase [Litorimonas cladophorae]
MTAPLFSPLTLPNGRVVQNRLCKAAMEENMADAGQVPGQALVNLYTAWSNAAAAADAGPGIVLSGNVMVDPTAMTGPGGVVLQAGTLDDPTVRAQFERWAEAGKAGGSKFVMQISHPGRQLYAAMGVEPVSPSATKVSLPGIAAKMFAPARALTADEVRGQIRRFGETALAAQAAGFDGVQIHAAHGYLVAQFLSPLTNQRDDEWGGPLENRARFLLEIVRSIRNRVDPDFIVGVKLNSADFQKGGFDIVDSEQVVDWLNAEAVDFIEVSGGSYESSAMMGNSADGRMETSTAKRELYFFDFAKRISKIANMPVMVTGGVTKRETAISALTDAGVAMVGIGRAFAYNPTLIADWRKDRATEITIGRAKWKDKALASLAGMALTKQQLYRLGDGLGIKKKQNALWATLGQQLKTSRLTKRYKAWLAAQNG